MVKDRNTQKGELEGKRPHGRLRHGWEGDIKMEVKVIGWEGVG